VTSVLSYDRPSSARTKGGHQAHEQGKHKLQPKMSVEKIHDLKILLLRTLKLKGRRNNEVEAYRKTSEGGGGRKRER